LRFFATGLDISLLVMTGLLSPEEKSKLKGLHRGSSTRKQGDKIKAILLLGQGCEYAEIASILLTDNSTVWPWHETYISQASQVYFKTSTGGQAGKINFEHESTD